MDSDVAHITAFIGIAVLIGVFWRATMKNYFLAVVTAAITGAGVTFAAFGMTLGRAPNGFFWVMSLPICGLIAAAIGIPFNQYLNGSASRLLGACAGLFVLTVVVLSGLIKLADSWGEVFEFNAPVSFVVIGAFMTFILGGILAGLRLSSPKVLREREEKVALAISGLPTTSTEAAAELAGTPDTVIVHSRPLGAAFCVASAGILALWLVVRASNAGAWAWGAELLCFGLCGNFAIRIWKMGPGQLVVMRDGFRRIAASGRGNRRTRWGEIDGYFWTFDGAEESFVVYKLIQRDGRTQSLPRRAFDGSIPAGTTIVPAQLAQLLNRRLHVWRIAHGVDSAREDDA